MSAETEKLKREKPIPESKIKLVEEISGKIGSRRTVLIASCKGLPGLQFHEIKKKLRGKAEIKVARKSAIERAIDSIEKGYVKNLKEYIKADIVVFFSDLGPFELSSLLTDNQSPAKARAGDTAPEDIEIEAGPTELVPGPAISELSGVGLKVAVKEGKLEIMKGAVVVRKDEKINANVANVLGKLDINPMKVGFSPLAAYDSKEDKIYVDIVIDKKGTLEALKELLGKALGFAINVEYPTKETISYFISKACAEEKTLSKLVKEKPAEKAEEKVEEKAGENKEENKDDEKEKAQEQDTQKEEIIKEESKKEKPDSDNSSDSNKQDIKEENS